MTQFMTIYVHPDQLINSNHRAARYANVRKVRALRELGFWMAKSQLKPVACRQKVTATFGFLSWGKRDPNNWAPSTKALIDGLTDAKIWPDDNAEWVVGPDHRRGALSTDCHTQPVRALRRVQITLRLDDDA